MKINFILSKPSLEIQTLFIDRYIKKIKNEAYVPEQSFCCWRIEIPLFVYHINIIELKYCTNALQKEHWYMVTKFFFFLIGIVFISTQHNLLHTLKWLPTYKVNLFNNCVFQVLITVEFLYMNIVNVCCWIFCWCILIIMMSTAQQSYYYGGDLDRLIIHLYYPMKITSILLVGIFVISDGIFNS